MMSSTLSVLIYLFVDVNNELWFQFQTSDRASAHFLSTWSDNLVWRYEENGGSGVDGGSRSNGEKPYKCL